MDDIAQLGRDGERTAERFLRRLRYRTVVRNYLCPAGEIDLVMLDRDVIVFVEVKTRSSREHADPQDAVNPVKQRQIARAARYFLQQTRSLERTWRFDVIAISLSPEGRMQIEHFPEAFAPTS